MAKRLTPSQHIGPEADIVLAIRQLRADTPHPSTIRWVKGHADATKTIHTLNQSQCMNVDMDGAAASCRRHDIATPQRHYPGSKAMLSLADQWVTTAYRQRI